MEKKKNIGFWRVSEPYGEFSNWWLCPIFAHGEQFCSSEQAYMYLKAVYFGDEDIAKCILSTDDQREIKKLGRKVSGFVESKWNDVRYDIMTKVLYAKFTQNRKLRDKLLATEDAYIFEDSPYDYIWGVGADKTGQNLLGKALMKVRDWLREDCELEKGYER